ncbi:FAD-dependent oxidoreductase [Pseudonocardia oroxyli]|uniref:FAD dependent oxidoreductase n=1 Tax=Pseudonocardia oroxyli TaxID=366584 RepID=A0A1G8BCP6_PSEOR|nr:FAD-dependent oxidoreductase [Pseudonocardia oroxyli]SDH30948.1 FAD dependent oxidoreductase [Pseudonocardia oroxyli]
MRVAVVGAGIAGLSIAHYLSASPDVQVTVLEAAEHPGGRADVTPDGGEHCTRYFLDDYLYLTELMQEIPFDRGSVFDLLQPVQRMAPRRQGGWSESRHLYPLLDRSLPLRDRWAISKGNRVSLLVARRSPDSSNVFGAAANFSLRSLLDAVANMRQSVSGSVLPGSTAQYFVEPWVAHLQARGVKIHCGREVTRLTVADEGVELGTGESREAFDVVVVTAFAHDLYALLDRSGHARKLDWRTHTHCKALTIDLDPREPILTDPRPRTYSKDGTTTLLQPAASRCVAVPLLARSTVDADVLGQIRDHLGLRFPPLRVRSRTNLRPGEAVFVGEHVRAEALTTALAGARGKVYFAGSYIANSYRVDSAESACRSAYAAIQDMAAVHCEIVPALRMHTVPAARELSGTVNLPHPNTAPSERARARLWRLAQWASIATCGPIARLDVVGDARVDGPAVYVANHRSIFDVVAGLLTFRHLGVQPVLVVNERYFTGLAGKLLELVGAIPALRGSDATIRAAEAAVRAGSSVAFMPEGRIIDEAAAPAARYGRGAFEVAESTGRPVIPLGSWGTGALWPDHRPWPLVRVPRARVVVTVGRPIWPRDSADLEGEVRAAVETGVESSRVRATTRWWR